MASDVRGCAIRRRCVVPDYTWAIGVGLTTIGMLLSNVGTQVAKIALNRQEEEVGRGRASRKHEFCLPLYLQPSARLSFCCTHLSFQQVFQYQWGGLSAK